MALGTVRFDMFAFQVVPWPVMCDDVRYLETLDIGTVWLGDTYLMPPEYGGSVLEITPAPYDAWVAAGAWADRAALDGFAAREMSQLAGK